MSSPTLCRLEYLTSDGWQHGHAGIALLNPKAYVDRLTARGKYGRCTELGDDLKPNGVVHVSPNLPRDRSRLVPDPPYKVPKLGPKPTLCPICDETHGAPFDGSCLL